MSKLDLTIKCASMLKDVRIEAGMSQKEMSLKLDRSLKTIQNWESMYSLPRIEDIIEWFEVCGENSLRRILALLYPNVYDNLSHEEENNRIKEALLFYINEIASPDEIRKISYCIFGNTGSSWKHQLDLFTAYNHLPLRDRVVIAQNIYNSYEIEEATNQLVRTEYIMPNVEALCSAINACKDAAKNGKKGYN